MFGYRILKFAIFFVYWLSFAPWLILMLYRNGVLNARNLQDMFLQYSTAFFILILIYFIIHQVFEYVYLRYQIKKKIRKHTIRHQLKRLERGEIDLQAAQRISTFTKIKEPTASLHSSKKVVAKDSNKQQKGKAELKSAKTKEELSSKDAKEGVNKVSEKDGTKQNNKKMCVEKHKNEKSKNLVVPEYREIIEQEKKESAT